VNDSWDKIINKKFQEPEIPTPKTERKALGKGLSSLIPLGAKSDNSKNSQMQIPLSDLVANPNQPRKLFDKSAIDELAASIEEKGILQPILVRPIGGGKYEIIAGERRFRASQSLGLDSVPVIIKDVDEQETLEMALIENLQRQDLNPIEEALAYKELLGKFQYTQDELAKHIGKDRSSIANSLRLLKLPDNIREQIISGALTMGHARALLGIDVPEIQKKVAEKIVGENLSVRDIEDLVRNFKATPVQATDELNVDSDTDEQESSSTGGGPYNYRPLEEDLKKILKTKVKIKSSGRRGKLILTFVGIDELNRLVDILKK